MARASDKTLVAIVVVGLLVLGAGKASGDINGARRLARKRPRRVVPHEGARRVEVEPADDGGDDDVV